MEALYDLPNGDRVRVIDTPTVAQALGRVLELFRSGNTEPVFFGDHPRPEGVVITFDQWAEYETLKEDAEGDRRREELVRQRLANDDPTQWETYEQMMDRYGLDPDSDELKPKNTGDKGGEQPT
ncbi:hypothetical protein [Kribbella sindirgiensis]|uniref:Uncharacterized protein n=1 Tax=Kribbella sindirgiensis TaxID=1124744 RepID=A0A4R0IQH9_9ACTN|nr:hypothetical protein [Kribbella sindirgiensis]TCC33538.1 hypothetical protein E0H50_16350 [Kribbella sindirgiensis]